MSLSARHRCRHTPPRPFAPAARAPAPPPLRAACPASCRGLRAVPRYQLPVAAPAAGPSADLGGGRVVRWFACACVLPALSLVEGVYPGLVVGLGQPDVAASAWGAARGALPSGAIRHARLACPLPSFCVDLA